jgi:hypothetical protein
MRRKSDVIAKRLDNATVIVDIPTSRIFELNETGSRIWDLLGDGRDTESIVRCLMDEFDVEHSRATDEVSQLLALLRSQGLIEG